MVVAFFSVNTTARTPNEIDWIQWTPRVIAHDSTGGIVLSIIVNDGDSEPLTPSLDNGEKFPLNWVGDNTYEVELTATQVLYGHTVGDAHNFIGFLEVPGPRPPQQNGCLNMFVNVRTAEMPDVPMAMLDADVRASSHIVNFRQDAPQIGHPSSATLQKFYQYYDDEFDFITQVVAFNSVTNRSYRSWRNSTTGIGLGIYDNASTAFGSNRLLGTINFPIDLFFDLAETGALHELGHQWINWLNSTALNNFGHHWPISDVAYGIMGVSGPTGQGLNFPWELTIQPDGDVLVRQVERAREFNDLELYLMGLVPPESVIDRFVLPDQDITQLGNGRILPGPVEFVTIEDVILAEGERIPAAGDAQSDFAIATIVLSSERLLNDEEMAFFNHMAARGEAMVELPFSVGFETGVTKPFYLATGGRATLSSTMLIDVDGDGVPNDGDAFPSDPAESVDTDGDGIGNNADPDDDNDGLTDDEEINVYGTDPLRRDTDGDGLNDGEEIAVGLNPLDSCNGKKRTITLRGFGHHLSCD